MFPHYTYCEPYSLVEPIRIDRDREKQTRIMYPKRLYRAALASVEGINIHEERLGSKKAKF